MDFFSSQAESLSALFAPRSIAVVGASSNPQKIGGIPVDYQRRFGFDGALYPVNPNADRIQELQAWPSLRAIGQPVDLAILAVPAALVDGALDDAIAAKVKGVVLFSSGFAETGAEGTAAQTRLGDKARAAGVRLIGPNCLGFMNIARNVYATFSPAPGVGRVAAGRIGLVSQSGAFGAYAYSMARARGVGLSLWATTGNEADVQFADCLAWLAQDPATDVIMGYMEGCRDGPRLRAALALAQANGKPVVMVKVGSTALGAQAAASHTAALAGDDAVYDAVFRQYGVLRARNLTEFFDLAHSAAVAGRPRDRSIGLFTLSGGVGALMADEASAQGLDVQPLSEAAQDTLRSWVPFAAPRNPVDITGQVTNDMSLLERSARVMLDDRGFASWMGFLAAAGASDAFWPVLRELVGSLRAAYPDTLLAISTLLAPERRAELEAMRCLVFADPSDGIRTIAALAGLKTGAAPAADSAPASNPLKLAPGTMSEPDALALLAEAGVPVVEHRVVRSADEATAAAEAIGDAVVVKIVSADIPHKSDVGGVALGLRGAAQARAAFERTRDHALTARPDARLDGALVARMLGGGVECIAGVHRDPVFGPVLMFGLGGIHVETLRDVSLRALPITRDDALAMVRELRAFAILDGARGRAPVDLESIADALCALAGFALRCGDSLDSAEINPLIARPRADGGCVAVDALVVGRAG
ncbi:MULTISPECIES: acetate--CoA ligase family protein [unclassified Variovorax]|jgi:acyl-CoA synthetase (NDP forming)|uniref:acetate--CoA ligase family protein n=1 Tax=unclassified Variovorax TaxID=663243 RepID=UPI000F7F59DB|nr:MULTISPECIES: acetate--CoA ligase family protein [unclassified Variovorax]RSZ41237.1 CoA-binding protein [Variovorax sp. 553]RSZ41854.1 CoA-binding protein [Variovorax sp. 679]